jgi:hypothetical protein
MADDIVSDLAELQRRAAALERLLEAAQASAPQVEGSDSTGTLTATIGADGLPASLKVEHGWQRRIMPERFGSAVVEAFAAASANRMSVWGQALAEGSWLSTVDNVRREIEGPPTPVATAPPRTPPAAGARPLNDLINDTLAAFEHIDETTAASSLVAEGFGSSGYRQLNLGISAVGLVSCEVDAQWASHQSAPGLAAAFGQALAKAREDLAAKAAVPNSIDQLVSEALALLNDPSRLTQS